MLGEPRPRKRVLLVDDSNFARLYLRRVMGALDLDIEEATDGRAGLDCAAGAMPFDLVIADLTMPIMGGSQMLQGLRALPGYAEVPIMVVTGDWSEAAMPTLAEHGVRALVMKPVDPGLFLAAVCSLLGLPNPTTSRPPRAPGAVVGE